MAALRWLKIAWGSVGKYLTPVLVGLGVVLGLKVSHNRAKRRAVKKAEGRERARIEEESQRRHQEIQEEAHEIDREHADLDRDDLRKRMRDAARRSDDD